jgi:hypothetical protein
VLFRHQDEHDVDPACHPRHGPACCVTLNLASPNAGLHMPQRQLSLLGAENFFEPMSDHLIAS